jgi:hypothetical protein
LRDARTAAHASARAPAGQTRQLIARLVGLALRAPQRLPSRMAATSDATGSLARLALAVLVLLWGVAAVGLIIEGLERLESFRWLCVTGLGLGGAVWWRAARYGGLPGSLIDFDPSGTGLGGAPARVAVLVGAPAAL